MSRNYILIHYIYLYVKHAYIIYIKYAYKCFAFLGIYDLQYSSILLLAILYLRFQMYTYIRDKFISVTGAKPNICFHNIIREIAVIKPGIPVFLGSNPVRHPLTMTIGGYLASRKAGDYPSSRVVATPLG